MSFEPKAARLAPKRLEAGGCLRASKWLPLSPPLRHSRELAKYSFKQPAAELGPLGGSDFFLSPLALGVLRMRPHRRGPLARRRCLLDKHSQAGAPPTKAFGPHNFPSARGATFCSRRARLNLAPIVVGRRESCCCFLAPTKAPKETTGRVRHLARGDWRNSRKFAPKELSTRTHTHTSGSWPIFEPRAGCKCANQAAARATSWPVCFGAAHLESVQPEVGRRRRRAHLIAAPSKIERARTKRERRRKWRRRKSEQKARLILGRAEPILQQQISTHQSPARVPLSPRRAHGGPKSGERPSASR